MKGILKKTEEGWFVVFDQRTMQDPSAEDGILPLHPIDVKMIDEDSKVFDHIETRIKAYPNVEFEINMYDGKSHISNAWNGYAKIIDHIIDTNEMTEEHKERVQKLIDKDIFDQAILAMEEMYGSGCDEEIDAYFRGAKWMQQEYNK